MQNDFPPHLASDPDQFVYGDMALLQRVTNVVG